MSASQIVKVLSALGRVQRTEAVVYVPYRLKVKHSTSRVWIEALRRSGKSLSQSGRVRYTIVSV